MLEIIQIWFSINSALIFEFKFSRDWMDLLTLNMLVKRIEDGEYLEKESKRLSKLV